MRPVSGSRWTNADAANVATRRDTELLCKPTRRAMSLTPIGAPASDTQRKTAMACSTAPTFPLRGCLLPGEPGFGLITQILQHSARTCGLDELVDSNQSNLQQSCAMRNTDEELPRSKIKTHRKASLV